KNTSDTKDQTPDPRVDPELHSETQKNDVEKARKAFSRGTTDVPHKPESIGQVLCVSKGNIGVIPSLKMCSVNLSKIHRERNDHDTGIGQGNYQPLCPSISFL